MWVKLWFTMMTSAGPFAAWQRVSPLDAVRDATVLIEVLGPRGRSTGSGFVLTDDGTVATAAHVIQGAWQVRVRLASGEYVPILGVRHFDPRLDLALLAAPAHGIKPVRLGDSDSLRIGQRLLAVGCPFGLDIAVADGLLSAKQTRDGLPLLQISIPVSPGSSGGPVFTEDGEVVGLVVSGVRGAGAENVNFALPVNHLRERLAGAVASTVRPIEHLDNGQVPEYALASAEYSTEPLPPVNQSIGFAYRHVDGVEMLSRWKRQDGVEFTSLLRVGLSLTPAGDTLVERVRETRVARHGEVGQEVHRTLFKVGGENRFSASVRFHATPGRAEDYGSQLEARGERYLISDMSGGQHAGRAPRGVLPPSLADIALAANVDPLPDRVEFLVLDPNGERLLIARFDFSGRERRRIPLARPGTSCDGNPSVVGTEVEVLVGFRETGLERHPVVVLAAAPHLMIDDNLKCVRLSRL